MELIVEEKKTLNKMQDIKNNHRHSRRETDRSCSPCFSQTEFSHLDSLEFIFMHIDGELSKI